MKNKLLIGIAVFAGIIFIFALRTFIFSYINFSKGEELLKKEKLIEASVEFKHALRNYVPCLGKSSAAAEELLRMARKAEESGDKQFALRTLRMLRGGILSIRGLYQPFSDVLNNVNEKIVMLMAENDEVKQKEYLVQLQEDRDPSILFSFLSSFCFILWIGLTILGIFKSFTKEGLIIRKQLLIYGSISIFLLALWLFFLWLS